MPPLRHLLHTLMESIRLLRLLRQDFGLSWRIQVEEVVMKTVQSRFRIAPVLLLPVDGSLEKAGAPVGRKGAPAESSAAVHLRLQYGFDQNGVSAV